MSNANDQDSHQDFARRFSALADEAQKDGVNACVLLHSYDPIAGCAATTTLHRGDPTLVIALLQKALWNQQKGQ